MNEYRKRRKVGARLPEKEPDERRVKIREDAEGGEQ